MTGTLFLIFACMCIIPLYKNVKKSMLFAPDSIFLFSFLIYRSTMPINYLFLGNDYGYSEEFVNFENTLSIMMIGFFLLGYNITNSGLRLPVNVNFKDVVNSKYVAWSLCLVGIVLYALFIFSVYGNPLKMYLVSDRLDFYKSKQGLGFLVIGREIVIFGLVVAFNRMMYLKKSDPKKNKISKSLIIVILLFFMHNLLLGDRNPIVNFMLGISVVFWMFFKRTKKIILTAGPFLFIGFIVMGVLRGLPKNASYSDFLTKSYNWKSLDPTSNGELATHFKIDHDVLYVSDADYKYGASYFEAFIALVPKGLISERPEYLTEWYANKFHKDIFDAGGGFGFSLIAESYLNFGTLGMAIVGFALGFGCKKMYGWIFNNLSILTLSIYGISLYYIFLLMRSGITPFVKPYLFSVFVPYWIFSFFTKGKYSVSKSIVSRKLDPEIIKERE